MQNTDTSFCCCCLDSLLVDSRTRDRKFRVRVPAGAAGEFSSPELTFCADSYSASVSSHVTAVAHKRPRLFCQKCRWQVATKHACTLDQMKSEWARLCCPGIVWEPIWENEVTRNSSGNTRSQSSQLAEPLWTDPGLKRVELVSAS